jgi:hypothetical protein
MQLDLADLDAEQITILSPLSRYAAERGYFRVENLLGSEEARGLNYLFRGACFRGSKSKQISHRSITIALPFVLRSERLPEIPLPITLR